MTPSGDLHGQQVPAMNDWFPIFVPLWSEYSAFCPLNDVGISSVNIDTDVNKNTAFKTDVEEWHYPID